MLTAISTPETATRPSEVVLHELLVHKVELEMQIEELQRSHAALEDARDSYFDLYNFASVGYITIDQECLINEINLPGASMLGIDRIKLVNRNFSTLVSPLDRDRWHRLFVRLLDQAESERQVIVLGMTRAGAGTFSAYIECQRRKSMNAHPLVRLALIDIDRIKQAEMEILSLRTAAPAIKAR